jgi:hypothetical protein
MNFTGIGLYTSRFTCCCRNEQPSADNPRDKRIGTFGLSDFGLAQFFKTLTEDSYVLTGAAITASAFARLFKNRAKAVVIASL